MVSNGEEKEIPNNKKSPSIAKGFFIHVNALIGLLQDIDLFFQDVEQQLYQFFPIF